jgi:hypothetical protein
MILRIELQRAYIYTTAPALRIYHSVDSVDSVDFSTTPSGFGGLTLVNYRLLYIAYPDPEGGEAVQGARGIGPPEELQCGCACCAGLPG